jgi:hypothetical protein
MMTIENLIEAYAMDASAPKGLGRFEVLNLLTNRDVLEEHKRELTTLQSARLLWADENLMANREQIILECDGAAEFAKLRLHNPVPAAWWWFLEQIPQEQFSPQMQLA